jgi:REP element-mobilizing transposase RayT
MQPRPIVPGATYLVTRRCTQRQYLLAPSKTTSEVFLYCLAYAAQKTRVRVHAVIVMSNHYHLVVTDELGVLPIFVECLNKLVAKTMNAHLGRWENFWASQQASYVQLLDDDAVIDKIAYAICNPVAAGRCRSSEEWPGVCVWRPGKRRAMRPDVFFRKSGCMPESVDLFIELPALVGTTPGQTRRRIEEAIGEHERSQQERILHEGQTFTGTEDLRRIDPFDSPRTLEPRRRLSPSIASRDPGARIDALARRADFLGKYRLALASWLEGIRTICFPFGTYFMRVRHAAMCADA